MRVYEPTTELIMLLVEAGEFFAAATVESGFIDSFEGCADLIAREVLNSARSGDYRGLEHAVEKAKNTIEFHSRWEPDIIEVLTAYDSKGIAVDCLKQALSESKDSRKTLEKEVLAASFHLNFREVDMAS